MRVGIILVGSLSTVVAIYVNSIYGLFYLCSDLVYVCLFPQLLVVVYMRKANIYGSAAGFLVGLVLRVTGGESLIKFPPLIYYPWWYEKDGVIYQNFPFKTLAMVISLLIIICVSYATHYAFTRGLLSANRDVWNGVVRGSNDVNQEKEMDDMDNKQNKMDGFGRDYDEGYICMDGKYREAMIAIENESKEWLPEILGTKVNPDEENKTLLKLTRKSELDVMCAWITHALITLTQSLTSKIILDKLSFQFVFFIQNTSPTIDELLTMDIFCIKICVLLSF